MRDSLKGHLFQRNKRTNDKLVGDLEANTIIPGNREHEKTFNSLGEQGA